MISVLYSVSMAVHDLMRSSSPPPSNHDIPQTTSSNATFITPPIVCMGISQILLALVIVVIILLAVFGNCGVIMSVIIYRRMRTFTNMLLVSLATSDLLVGLLIMPPAMVYLLEEYWRFGFFPCQIWATVDVLLCTASILNLCVISLDRYVAILWPLKYIRKRTKRLAFWLVLSVWVVSTLVCLPPWFVATWGFEQNSIHCGYVPTLSYRIYSACGSFYLPLAVMLFVYYRIFRVASTREQMLIHVGSTVNSSTSIRSPNTSTRMISYKGQRKISGRANMGRHFPSSLRRDVNSTQGLNNVVNSTQTHNHVPPFRPPIPCITPSELDRSMNEISTTFGPEEDPEMEMELARTARKQYERHEPKSLMGKAVDYYYNAAKPQKAKREKQIYLRERKALKTIGIIVIGFIICWLPFFLIYILQSACENCEVPGFVENVFLWLGYSNSLINPLIYTCYNQDFRRCFRDMIVCGCMRRKQHRRMSVKRLHMTQI